MSTIAENLIAINAQRLQLINILKSKNIPCDGTETFDELVQKVYAYQSEKDIILNDYSIAGCQLPTEDIEYMFNHYIVTSPLSTVTGK